MSNAVTLEEVLKLARQLPLKDKVKLIDRIAPQIEEDLQAMDAGPRRSLWGIFSDLGQAPSAEETDEARREEWRNFPRGDI
jgi:hypothetical protein